MSIFGRDWKRVESHIGTRSGAQIRSHAQKFFNRIEKELGADVETYIEQKAKAIFERKNKLGLGIPGVNQIDDMDHSDNDHIDNNNENSHPPVLESPRKQTMVIEMKPPMLGRDRSISHTFGVAELLGQANSILNQSLNNKNDYHKLDNSSAGSKTSNNKSQNKISQIKTNKGMVSVTGGNHNSSYEPSKFSLKQSKPKKNKER